MAMQRTLGQSDILVSAVALGCWPISGMTSLDVNRQDSLATLLAAVESGINFFDTAYSYGANGESERLIAEALASHRDQIVLATKCGLSWNDAGVRHRDGSPENLRTQVDESLTRLNVDNVELLYLHAPDPNTPVSESAGELLKLKDEGKAQLIGVSNFNVQQLDEFHSVCPISVVQPPYNMLQRGIEDDVVPWCQQHGASLAVYWPLMKGLLAGKLTRDHVFQPGDGRAKYPMFQGDEWEKNQDFVDALRVLAADHSTTVAQLSVRWSIEQPGITAALCGAKRAYQIEEVAGAMRLDYPPAIQAGIAAALERRGTPITRTAVR